MMSNDTFPKEHRVQLRELMRHAAFVSALAETERRCPKAFVPGADTKMEAVALQSAHVQGYKDCLAVLRSLASEESSTEESPFMDMTNESDRNIK